VYRHRYVSHIKRFPSEIRNKGTYLKSETFLFDFFAAKKEGIYLFIRDCKAKVILVFALTVWL